MKKVSYALIAGLISAATLFFLWPSQGARQEYEAYLRTHPFKQVMAEKNKQQGEEQGDRPDLAKMQDFFRTMNPQIKRPTPEKLFAINETTARLRDHQSATARTQGTLSISTDTEWEERGPNNVGGRTRALMFDPNDATNKKVWAGGVSGGLWFNNDITDATSEWQKVDDFWDNLAITCIAHDPVNKQVFYVGTGEGWFNFDLVVGAGIWKSTNGGTTWTRLPSTENFRFVNDIVVRNENGSGVVYAAIQGNTVYNGLNINNNGLFRSTNGGNTWSQVMPDMDEFFLTDIEIASSNQLFVGAKSRGSNPSRIYTSPNGADWSFVNFTSLQGRVEIACAPSNPQIAYAIIENDNKVGAMAKTTNGGSSWSAINQPVDADTDIPADDFSRGQAWYNLILAVHPTDANNVMVGTIDLFKSTNGGTSWAQVSRWNGGININAPVVHADHHAIMYRPGFPNEAIFGNDGGVYYGTGLNNAPSAMVINGRNNQYNVTQFYSGTIHPTQKDYMLGGTQDNGTLKFTQALLGSTSEAFGGDGGPCFIDLNDPTFQIVSYTNNNFQLSTNGGNTFNITLLEDGETGSFINTGDYDSNLKILYTARDETSIYRVRNVNLASRAAGQVNVNLGSMATAMKLSPFSTTASNLYIGTEAGRLFRVQNAHNSPAVTEITGPSFPTGSVSSIAFGASENQMLVTFSNYGVTSVWETRNGGANWSNREGNLPDMPVRWAVYHPLNPDQVFLATELGVWSTDDVNETNPTWNSTNGGLANVRVDMLQVRTSDFVIQAATHGRGVFTALLPTSLDQTITFPALTNKTFGEAPFQLNATASSGLNVSYVSSNAAVATIAGNTVTVLASGSTTITASQAGNVQYKAAQPVSQTLTVNKASQAITFSALPQKSINDTPFALTASASSSLTVSYASSNTGVATVSGNTVTITGVGTTTITANQSGNTNYLAAPAVTQQLTVVSRIIQLTGTLAFGDVIIGEQKQLSFNIENQGTAPLSVTGINYPSGYTGTSSVSGNNIVVTVTLSPTASADYDGEIEVESDATSGNNKIAVTGKGVLITGDIPSSPLVRLFPNPANSYLEIYAPGLEATELQLTGADGRAILKGVEKSAPETVRMMVNDLVAGTWLVAVPVGERIQWVRFVKN